MKRAVVLIACSATVYALVAWWAAAQLPGEDVAMHVNTAGQVDESASRSGAISFFIGLGSFLLVLAVAMLCMLRWVPARFLNIPNKDYWTSPERAPTVRQMILWDTAVIFSMPFLALSFIPVNVALLSDDPGGTSALWIVLPIALWLIAMACYALWMVKRR